jgi:hypothetical protein
MLKCHGQLKRRSKRIRAIAIQLLLAEKWIISFIHQYLVLCLDWKRVIRNEMPIQSILNTLADSNSHL